MAHPMGESEHDVLACMAFPRQHCTKLHSTNPIERLNKEVKRRADVVGNFPNEDSIIRLIGAVLFEQNDEWQTASLYMIVEAFAHIDHEETDPILQHPSCLIVTRLSCRKFRNNEVRLQLRALAYNLANFMRTPTGPIYLTSLQALENETACCRLMSATD